MKRSYTEWNILFQRRSDKVKKVIAALALILCAALGAAQPSPTINVNSAYFGVSFFTLTPATATAVSNPMRLPTFTGYGTLTVTEAGITGSPSGCTVALAYQGNNSLTATSAVSTTSFTPSTGVQTFAVAPTVPSGDQYVATFACSVYPTAGTITASFSPGVSAVSTTLADPCQNNNTVKSSAAINITTATTTQLVALSASKVVYVCGLNLSAAGTAPAITVEYGTGSACGTGTTVLTGAMAPTAGSFLSLSAQGPIVATPASNALCVLTAGTGSPSFQGVLTYVSQ